jgi:hypothetical protein
METIGFLIRKICQFTKATKQKIILRRNNPLCLGLILNRIIYFELKQMGKDLFVLNINRKRRGNQGNASMFLAS